MGEGASSKPVSFGRYVAFYAILFYCVAFCSISRFYFVPPFTLRVLHIAWLILIDKRWNVLACLLSLAAFVRYVFFNSNKEYSIELEDDFVDLPFPSSSMASDLHSYPPLSSSSYLLTSPATPSSSFTSLMSYPHSSFTSRSSSLSSPWSSPQSSPRSAFGSSPPSSFTSTPSYLHSSFTSPSSSLSSPSYSPQSSPRSAFPSSSLPSSPPPPPFKMRPWKFNYVRMASNVSLSSEDSGDSDIDTKADKFITKFRSQLKFEEERRHERANKARDLSN